jgi:YidC/Oxa1 family membrane protein insertase
MERFRFLLAIALSALILAGWPIIMHHFFPQPVEEAQPDKRDTQLPHPDREQTAAPAKSAPGVGPALDQPTQFTQAQVRDITISTPFWDVKLSSRGAVATSWVLKREKKPDGSYRDLKPASGQLLELIPQDVLERLGAPLSLRLPSSPELEARLNSVSFQIEGIAPDRSSILLGEGDQAKITFTYSSPEIAARKSFTFYGDRMVFDLETAVVSKAAVQPAEIMIGPRIGDQSDNSSGSYSTPPQVIAFELSGSTHRVVGAKITPPFAKIKSVDYSANKIQIDAPLAGDVDQVKILGSDGTTFIGYAHVTERESNSHVLTLDSLPQGVAAGNRLAQATDTIRRSLRWVGLVDHYFAMVAIPAQPIDHVVLTNMHMKAADEQTARDYPAVSVPVYADSVTHIFVGPKDRDLLAQTGAQLGTDLTTLIDYGMFAVVIRPLVPVVGAALNWTAKLFHNYGWGIVLVTVAINLLLSPLRLQSSRKMKKAAKHQPRIKELQEKMKKLKENPKKYEREIEQLQREQMEIMKEANPLGGCLPLLLQMPIFWAFFVYLTISLDVRHAPWILWVKDLSAPDPYKILPIIMCATMIGSSLLQPMPQAADPSMKMQRVMMTWLMPILLTWLFFFNAPSGLVLYWMVSSLVGMAIQYVINKLTAEPAETPPPPKAGKGKADATGKRKVAEKEMVGSTR